MHCAEQIETMQHNLVHIRKTLGMSAREFGELIGVTRQTINNIEVGRNKLHQTQYLAILYVLEKLIFPRTSNAEREMVERLMNEKIDKSVYMNSLVFKAEGL